MACQDDSDATHRKAIEELCEIYWYPIYAFVRRKGRSVQDAQEMTQAFFVKILESGFFEKANPENGRLRSFLMKSVSNFLVSDYRKSLEAKGVFVESIDFEQGERRFQADSFAKETPETLFEKRWATTLIDEVFARLETETTQKFGADTARLLIAHLRGTSGVSGLQELAAKLGLSEPAIKVRMHRLRQDYRRLLRKEVADTIGPHDDVDAEIRALIALL